MFLSLEKWTFRSISVRHISLLTERCLVNSAIHKAIIVRMNTPVRYGIKTSKYLSSFQGK